MCGILGGFQTDLDESSLSRLRHRGPDQQGFARETFATGEIVTLGVARLNIVDRRDILLPVQRNDCTILLNGEIYNHPELRRELEVLGWTFQTRTDSEVALAAFLQWGTDCLHRFNGMFALAIWDGRRFFCARDRMGKKPFFYRIGAGSFSFASEIKAFPGAEFSGSDMLELFEFCFDAHTPFRGIYALPPASYLIYDTQSRAYATHVYWDPANCAPCTISDTRVAVDAFMDIFTDAVRMRLRADVPISIFLAGGLDSSLVAAIAGVDEAFTCQFDEYRSTINEERYARDLTDRLGIRLHVIRPTRDDFLQDLPSLADHLEIPTGSFSVFPLYRLALAARSAGYKAVLSGEGSDELFAGYVRNEALASDALSLDNPKRRRYASLLSRYHGDDLDRFCRMASRSGLAGAAAMRRVLETYWCDQRSLIQNMCLAESRIFLQPLLQMADRMCMAHGVEGRCPFLDHRLVEFAFSLDDSLRYRDGSGKWIVRQAAKRLLPRGSYVLTRPVKHGLPTPVNEWLLGRNGFDRKFWNTLMTAQCAESLMNRRARVVAERVTPMARLAFPLGPERSSAGATDEQGLSIAATSKERIA